jgi:hypothetical protein
LLRVRIREISPANRAANDQIASDQHLLLGKIISHMPGRVTRRVQGRDLQRPDLQLLVVGDMHVRLERRYDQRELKQPCLYVRMLSFELIQFMKQNLRRRKPLPDSDMVGEVVKVAVRQPQPNHVPPPVRCLLEQRSTVWSGASKITACLAASSATRKQLVIATPPVFVSNIMAASVSARLLADQYRLAGEGR